MAKMEKSGAFPIDLKHFKKVSADKNHTTLQHKDGHSFKIAHAALSPKMRGQLAEMPVHMADGQASESKGKKPVKMADGGQVPDDSDPSQNSSQAPAPPPVTINIAAPGAATSSQPQAAPAPDYSSEGPGGKQFDFNKYALQNPDTTPVSAQTQALAAQNNQKQFEQQDAGKAAAQQSAEIAAYNAQAQQAGLPLKPMPEGAQQPSNAQPMQAAQAPGGPASQGPGLGANTQLPKQGAGLDIMAAYNEGLKGIGTQAKAEQAVAQDQFALQQQNAADQAKLAAHFDEVSKASEKEYQALVKDYNDHPIVANRVWNDKSTLGKVSTAIGLILGGMGGGLLHQENPALKMLNAEIDRDVDAQKANQGRTQNLLSANMAHYRNTRDAYDATRLGLASIAASQLQAAALKQGGPMAQARAQQATSELMAKWYPLKRDLDMRTAVQNFATQPGVAGNDQRTGAMLSYLRIVNPKMAEEMEGRYVPGVGMGSIPVPTAARDNIMAKQQLNAALKDLSDWSQKHSGSVDPATVKYGAAKAAEIQSMYRNAINGGVFKKGEQEYIDNIIDSDPTKFFSNIRVLPKIKAVLQTNDAQLNSLKRNYGLPVEAPAPEIKVVNGVKYMRGPDGKAVRVGQ